MIQNAPFQRNKSLAARLGFHFPDAAMSKVGGGMSSWLRLVEALKGTMVGPYKSLKNVLSGSGRNGHHINQTAVYPRMPREDGAASIPQSLTAGKTR
jgi:hypothetical protein